MRLRLTLWFALSVALVAAAGVFLTYGLLARQLRTDLDAEMAHQLQVYTKIAATASDPRKLLAVTEGYLAGPDAQDLRSKGFILSLRLDDGSVVSNSGDLRLEQLPAAEPLLTQGTKVLTSVNTPRGRYRLAGTPVLMGDRRVAVVEVASPVAAQEATLRRVLIVLVSGALVGTALVGLGSWFLIGRALRPVRTMSRTATAISREDLTRRIDYRGPDDEIGELAETLDSMLDRLEVSFDAQERFVSDVSHELRTPLTIMKGHLQVLDRNPQVDPAQIREEHALVLEELDRMNRLVGDLLTLARASREDHVRRERIALDAFLSTLIEQGPHLADRDWRVDELPGGTVGADQDGLTQVLLNLMQNAVAHTQPGQVVALGGSRSPDHVRLWVRDTGRGMDPATLERVFEPFFSGPSPAGGRTGLGLGLAIVKAIVGVHGGWVEVESEVEKGSRFAVILPP